MVGFDVLRAYLEPKAVFSEADFALMATLVEPRHLPAGAFLQRAGDVTRHAAFIAAGCLRNYIIDAKGKEHIVQFAPEEWWLADNTSMMTGQPSQYFVDAVEDSDVLLLTPSAHGHLIERIPGYAQAFRTGLQRHAAAKDRRIAETLSASAEERYLQFIETYPSIAQRVPQFMLASYLGISPETLSRVRRHLATRRG